MEAPQLKTATNAKTVYRPIPIEILGDAIIGRGQCQHATSYKVSPLKQFESAI